MVSSIDWKRKPPRSPPVYVCGPVTVRLICAPLSLVYVPMPLATVPASCALARPGLKETPVPALATAAPTLWLPASAGEKLIPLPAPRMVVPAPWSRSSPGVKVMPVPGDARVANAACEAARAGLMVTPVPGCEESRTVTPTGCTNVSGVVRVRPEPFAPAVPMLWMTLVSWLAPLSMTTVSPAAKPATLATRSVVGPAGSCTFVFHGATPYAPVTLATGQEESSKPAVFQPAGGEAGVPGSAFQVASVTILVESSCAAAMTLPAPPPLNGAMAMTFVPGTSSDRMSLICEVCQALLAPADAETCTPLT